MKFLSFSEVDEILIQGNASKQNFLHFAAAWAPANESETDLRADIVRYDTVVGVLKMRNHSQETPLLKMFQLGAVQSGVTLLQVLKENYQRRKAGEVFFFICIY